MKIDGRETENAIGWTNASGAQNLLDSGKQPFTIREHGLIKLFAFAVLDCTSHQRLQIEPNRGDRSFQLVRNGINKCIMLLVPPNCPDQEDGVQHYAANDDGDQDKAEEEQNAGTPVEENPADVKKETD